MNINQWLDKVRENKEVLRSLISTYHPSSRRCGESPILPITSPGAEAVCTVIRSKIRKEDSADPAIKFDIAVECSDYSQIYIILEQTWFGVPESRECWCIPGFGLAVEVLDDGPEEEG